MQTTGMSRRDRVVAVAAALMVNALVVWQLPSLLAPAPGAAVVEATTALQVAWIVAIPRRDTPAAAPTHPRTATARVPPVSDRPRQPHARTDLATTAAAVDPAPARSMTAVYLQQAGQWAQDHPVPTAPAEPFANRRVPLADQAASRFRLKRPVSVAGTLAMVGLAFSAPGYTTDDCALIRGRVVGLVAGGDEQAAQQDLDYERRHCRP